MKRTASLFLTGTLALIADACAAEPATDRVATVMNTPGIVAFWDFVKREPDGAHRFTAHVPAGANPASAGSKILRPTTSSRRLTTPGCKAT